VCAVYAARYGDMIDSLCLVSALAFDIALSSPEQENRFTAFRNMLRFETAEDVEAFNQKLFYSPPKIPKTLLKYRLKELQRYESFHVRLLEHMQYSMNVLLKCLKYLPKHSMIIDGQNDSFLQDDSLLLIRRRCPWVVRKQIPECAHLPFIEKPVEVTRHYQGFLEHVIGTLTPEADLSSHPEPVL
ncbi:MAG: alpha/beta hydrolase, partial [Pseudomonadales bacterium]|nr:alpha/beta hydrolase [Pseudomonadales bacterium]